MAIPFGWLITKKKKGSQWAPLFVLRRLAVNLKRFLLDGYLNG